MHTERVDPEAVRPFRITRRDVTGDALVEAEAREQPVRSGKPLLAVEAFFLHRQLLGLGQPVSVEDIPVFCGHIGPLRLSKA